MDFLWMECQDVERNYHIVFKVWWYDDDDDDDDNNNNNNNNNALITFDYIIITEPWYDRSRFVSTRQLRSVVNLKLTRSIIYLRMPGLKSRVKIQVHGAPGC